MVHMHADPELRAELLPVLRRGRPAPSQHRRLIEQGKTFAPIFTNIKLTVLQSLDSLLGKYISESIAKRAEATSNLSQIAQIVSNLEHFQVACVDLERSLTNIR